MLIQFCSGERFVYYPSTLSELKSLHATNENTTEHKYHTTFLNNNCTTSGNKADFPLRP